MLRQFSLLLDNVLNRDKYLSSLRERIDFFEDKQSSSSRRVIDEPAAADPANPFAVPEINASDLNVDVVKQAMREHGCLVVRKLFNPDEVNAMRSYVDYSYSVHAGNDNALNRYLAKQVDLERVLSKTRDDIERKRATNSTYTNTLKIGRSLYQPFGKAGKNTSLLTVKSPILIDKLLDLYEKKGLKRLLQGYFENEPCVSMYKWVLRIQQTERTTDFHQDGAFMGDDIDSLNCWIPLTDCGSAADAPGVDIVPIRIKNTFGKGTGILDWTIAPDAVTTEYTEKAIVTPTFAAGDALFFDHLLIHRPQYDPAHVNQRYAIETWFFDSTNFPKNQIPLKW